jgi:hypothetical protein
VRVPNELWLAAGIQTKDEAHNAISPKVTTTQHKHRPAACGGQRGTLWMPAMPIYISYL